MAARKRAALSLASRHPPRPPFYTAQDVARFCEVDLSTIHHWVAKGRIPFRRTAGQHLRFRRNDVLRFLRAHDYPLPPALTEVRCVVSLAVTAEIANALAEELEPHADVHRHDSALSALASMAEDGSPDLLILSLTDPTLGPDALRALGEEAATSWLFVGALGPEHAHAAAREAGVAFALAQAPVTAVVDAALTTLALSRAQRPSR